jgi:hypothetical protein
VLAPLNLYETKNRFGACAVQRPQRLHVVDLLLLGARRRGSIVGTF